MGKSLYIKIEFSIVLLYYVIGGFSMKEDKKKDKQTKVSYMCLGNLLGIIFGLTVGRMLFNNPGAGLCFFAGLGMILGSIVDYRKKKRSSEERDSSTDGKKK